MEETTDQKKLDSLILRIINKHEFSLTFIPGKLTITQQYIYLKKYLANPKYVVIKILGVITTESSTKYKDMGFLNRISYIDYIFWLKYGGGVEGSQVPDSSIANSHSWYNQSLVVTCNSPHQLTPTMRPSTIELKKWAITLKKDIDNELSDILGVKAIIS